MSTQHTGDAPPGDDDYYDLEDMETNRATGSGRNPNAAAWDPEKMELHRIVNWLLALEERRALVYRPEEHGVLHKVNLPGFWEKDAAAWFRLADAVMEDNHVANQQAPAHPTPRVGEGQRHSQPGQQLGGPIHGAEEQAG